ncbi:hypothetical protein GGF31_006228 [Allomyces arbusculus]|nr:hypothetical protein GGF31_006228 [Allomyces arbusculus]
MGAVSRVAGGCLTLIAVVFLIRYLSGPGSDYTDLDLAEDGLDSAGTALSKHPQFYKAAAARILAWTPVAGKPGWEGFKVDFCHDLGAKMCVVTHQRRLKNHSSVVLFSSTDVDTKDLPRRMLHQPWVLYSEVSPVEHPPPYHVLRPETTRLFDYTMSYRLDSDFPIPPFGQDLVQAVETPFNWYLVEQRFADTSRAPILWVSTVCKTDNRRSELVEQLQRLGLTVDSLGGCPTNGEQLPSDTDLVKAMQKYKFVLVLETSNCHDYISRTFLRAIQAGSIPIVDGPKSYSAFLPHPDAAIQVDTYPTLADMAKELQHLAENQAAYSHRLQYRQDRRHWVQGWRDRWTSPRYAAGRRGGWCGLCRHAIEAEQVLQHERERRAVYEANMDAKEAQLMQLVDALTVETAKLDGKPLVAAKAFERDAQGKRIVRGARSLPLPRSFVPTPPRTRPAYVAPDYSCQLAKWAPTAFDPAAYRNVVPDDYLRVLSTNVSRPTWPKPIRRRAHRASRLADLDGAVAAAEVRDREGSAVAAALFPLAPVMDLRPDPLDGVDAPARPWTALDWVLAVVAVVAGSVFVGVVRDRPKRGLVDRMPLRRQSVVDPALLAKAENVPLRAMHEADATSEHGKSR